MINKKLTFSITIPEGESDNAFQIETRTFGLEGTVVTNNPMEFIRLGLETLDLYHKTEEYEEPVTYH